MAVDGHFHGDAPWYHARHKSKPHLAEIVGAKPEEVVCHEQLIFQFAFFDGFLLYRPTAQRFKIISEAGAFPSDLYALESQVKLHGLDPEKTIIELSPRTGEYTLRTEDILEAIKQHGDELALIMMGGLQYYTGQVFDMQAITAAGHAVSAQVGFDLAHAVGNVPLQLHDWDVDFATWCTYKYLNSGPGNISGIFVHERHAMNPELPRLAGWWGYDEAQRFQMTKGFKPMYGADGWQLSNTNILALAAHEASLEIFHRAGIERLRTKSLFLTGYLEFLIKEISQDKGTLEIITPSNPHERGCQLSLFIHKGGRALFDRLYEKGVVGDWRNPNVIRVAPIPLYNSFEDVYQFAKILEETLAEF